MAQIILVDILFDSGQSAIFLFPLPVLGGGAMHYIPNCSSRGFKKTKTPYWLSTIVFSERLKRLNLLIITLRSSLALFNH